MNLEINITNEQIEALLEKVIRQKVNDYFKRYRRDIEDEWKQATYTCISEMLRSEEGKATLKNIEQEAFAKRVAEHISQRMINVITSSFDDYDYY